jgi:hypothetical protein
VRPARSHAASDWNGAEEKRRAGLEGSSGDDCYRTHIFPATMIGCMLCDHGRAYQVVVQEECARWPASRRPSLASVTVTPGRIYLVTAVAKYLKM